MVTGLRARDVVPVVATPKGAAGSSAPSTVAPAATARTINGAEDGPADGAEVADQEKA